MHALLLPGNSPRHAEWIEKLKDTTSSHFETVATQYYQHWKNGNEWANIDHEIIVASEKTTELNPYVIIGKSIGAVIAIKGSANNALHPEKIILLGIPIKGGIEARLFAQWLHHINVPVVVVQNAHDPLGSFAEVKAAFEHVGNDIIFVELEGETHDYLDFEAITRLI